MNPNLTLFTLVGLIISVLSQKEADLRIIGSATSGRLEVYHNSVWGTVCDDDFDQNNFGAKVACYQLGYENGVLVTSPNTVDGSSSQTIWLDNVACTGSETRLADCPRNGWGVHNCRHLEDVGVSCSTPCLETPENVDIRIISICEAKGRLEINNNGEWGTVCEDDFDNIDATVACNELGYKVGEVVSSTLTIDGSGKIWLDNVDCTGSEGGLKDCINNGLGMHDCEHSQDVGISCSVPYVDGELRLVSGPSKLKGRLEIFHNNEWGTVCDDRFDNVDAKVACNELGYENGVMFDPTSISADGNGRTWLDEVQCTGTEASLAECPNNGWGNADCQHYEDIGISCSDAYVDWDLRIADGPAENKGRLEIYYNNVWGTVNDGSFDNVDATIACNQLGYKSGRYISSSTTKDGKGQIWLASVGCTGIEAHFKDCTKTICDDSNCGDVHSGDVGIECSVLYVDGDLRIVEGTSPTDGRLEILHNGEWGTICDDNFGYVDAKVACNQLGYKNAAIITSDSITAGSDQKWLDELQCDGSEAYLADCQHAGWGVSDCMHDEDIGISCRDPYSNPELYSMINALYSMITDPYSAGESVVAHVPVIQKEYIYKNDDGDKKTDIGSYTIAFVFSIVMIGVIMMLVYKCVNLGAAGCKNPQSFFF